MSTESLGDAMSKDLFAAMAAASQKPKPARIHREKKMLARLTPVDGRTVRQGHERTAKLSLKMNPAYKQELDGYCERAGMSMTEVIELAVLQYIRGN